MDPETIIRQIPTEDRILRSSRRVKTFTAMDCIASLSRKGFGAEDIKKMLQDLLNGYKIIKVKKNGVNQSSIDIVCGKNVTASDIYMWTEESTNYWSILMGIAIVGLILFLVMFQMWPNWLKKLVGYSKYPLLAFIGFLVVAGIIRLIVFGITVFSHPPGLWLLPNLFADCGFFESFVPLYSWADQDTSHKKNKKND